MNQDRPPHNNRHNVILPSVGLHMSQTLSVIETAKKSKENEL